MRPLYSHIGLIVAMLLAVPAHSTYADILAIEGRPMVVGVKIVELTKGQLSYRLPAGHVVRQSIAEVKFLQLTGWQSFNEAEQLQRDGRLRQSASAYEKALKQLAISSIEEKLDRALLVQCRLLRVYDAQGRFDQAVAMYLNILERMPEILETLRPVKLPAAGSSFLPDATTAISKAIGRHKCTSIGQSLEAWRATWPGQSDSRQTSAETPDKAATETEQIRQLRDQIALIEAHVNANRFDEALTQIAPVQNEQAGFLRADLYYWQARAWLGKSQSEEGSAAQRDRRRAGLAFMRVVVHFPGHQFAPECLYRAGQICQVEGRNDLAERLWSQLRRNYPDDTQRKIKCDKLNIEPSNGR